MAATIISADNITLGSPCRIAWTPESTSQYFELQFWCGDVMKQTGNIYPGTTSRYEYTGYTPTLEDFAGEITNAKSRGMTIVLWSFGGSNGSNAVNVTCTVPENANTKPAIGSVALSEGTASGFGTFVKMLSKVRATITGAYAKYGASITAYQMKVDGYTYSENAPVINADVALKTSGNVAVTIDVIDSRGFKSTINQTITVVDYFKPSGEIRHSISGTTVTVTASWRVAPVMYGGTTRNTVSVVITRTKKSTGAVTTYTMKTIAAGQTSTSGYSGSSTWVQTLTDIDRETYTYSISVTDKANASGQEGDETASARVALSLFAGGWGASFFEEAETEGLWVRDRLHGDDTTQVPFGGHGTPTTRDMNNITITGTYWIDGQVTVNNRPDVSQYDGVLEVECTDNNYGEKRVQRFTPHGHTETYARTYNGSQWSAWKKQAPPISTDTINSIKSAVLQTVFPVGSIYMSYDKATNPNTLLGFGTWTSITGRFLLGAGSIYTATSTGGSATHTPSGSVGSHTLTVNEIPAHAHALNIYNGTSGSGGGVVGWNGNGGGDHYVAQDAGGTSGHSHSFNGLSQNTMPPYLAVYMWRRTA